VFAFHGASPYFVDGLVEQGRLPNWSRIAKAGASGRIIGPFPISAGSWASLYTGLEPDQHGILDAYEVDARRFPPVWTSKIDSSGYQQETMFSLASNAGRRVAGINVPMTAPPWPVNGMLISAVPLDDESRPPTFPPDLTRHVSPVSPRNVDDIPLSDIGACRNYLDRNLSRVVQISGEMYASEPFDLFMTAIITPDYANHLFHRNPALGADWRGLIDEYFEKSDAALGEFEQMVGPDSTLIVVSEVGSGPMPPLWFRANSWLESAGLLSRKRNVAANTSVMEALQTVYRFGLKTRVIQRVKPYLPQQLVRSGRELADHWSFVDITRTRVYAVNHHYPLAAFEVNLAGRQAYGIVNRDDYEAVRTELIQALESVRLPDGRPLCRRIFRREDLFTGPKAELLADVIAELDPDVEANLGFAARLFEPNQGYPNRPYRGYHYSDSLMAIRGPGIPDHADLGDVPLRDVMPTIMRLLDLPVPPDRRGRPLAVVENMISTSS
jgi:predicted AlkP superfamily phosphohydrolase/phosphomutase